MSGTILAVADTNNHTIRKIAANGDVTVSVATLVPKFTMTAASP